MRFVERTVRYFTCCGETNTADLLETVKTRCTQVGPERVVVASETGRSALTALKILRGADIEMVVVTHYPAKTWGPKGAIPIGLKRNEYAEHLKTLTSGGATVVQGTRPFAPPSRSLNWDTTPEGIIDKTLELFGAGTKIAIEAAVMATDAGAISQGDEVVSCAGTFKGLDTALLVKTSFSMNFFNEFEVNEVIAKPSPRVKELPEHEYRNWKGNLDKYYP